MSGEPLDAPPPPHLVPQQQASGEKPSNEVSNSDSTTNTTPSQQHRHLSEEEKKIHMQSMPRVQEIINRLLDPDNLTREKLNSALLSIDDINFLITNAKMVITNQPIVLSLAAPVKIFGDIHGQYLDLLRWLEYFKHDPQYSLFLGDYVDRGKNSIETICLLLAFKIKYPLTFFLLRGNHETANINRVYGFFDEVKRRYNVKLYKNFCELFKVLPLIAIIEEKIFCCHGGLSQTEDFIQKISKMPRSFEISNDGPDCDIVWSDPAEKGKLGWSENARGISMCFGNDVLEKFLKNYNLDLIVRAHQVVEDGYEFFCLRKGVTIFSAPNYCGEFDNAGGAVYVSEDLCCEFKILTPKPKDTFRSQYVMPTISQLKNAEDLLTAQPEK